MLNLPYIPQHYPDEILGSWLARTALFNGRGAWRVLLENSGFGRQLHKPLFDIPDFDQKVNNLLTQLGCSYDYALLELSTFQYWASFQSSKTEFVNGSLKIKALVNKGRVIVKPGQMGNNYSESMSLRPYFCSLCLISDISKFGEPYWHRSHQLPTVYYCPTHHILLQNKCTNCGVFNKNSGRSLMPLPSLVCLCGNDHRDAKTKFIIPTDIYRNLTRISIAALENKEQNWSDDNVKAYVNNYALEAWGGKKGQITSAIQKVVEAQNISQTKFLIKAPGNKSQVLFNRNLYMYRAPDFCLFLACMNIDFANASRKFTLTHSLTKGPSSTNVRHVPQNAEIAFLELSELRKKNVKPNLMKYRMSYWYLRLQAVDYLKSFVSNIDEKSIPSIEKDRIKILKELSQSKSKYKSSAMIRADIRDNKWLADQIKQRKRNSKDISIALQKQNEKKTVEILKHKLKEELDKEGRPERLTFTSLGTQIGFSNSQIILLLRKYPELNDEIKRINMDKPSRQLVWAAKELKNEGISITAPKIYHKAGLRKAPETLSIVRKILNDK